MDEATEGMRVHGVGRAKGRRQKLGTLHFSVSRGRNKWAKMKYLYTTGLFWYTFYHPKELFVTFRSLFKEIKTHIYPSGLFASNCNFGSNGHPFFS